MCVLTLWLPFSPLADPLGLTSLSPVLLLALAGITAAYVVSAECAKRVFYRRTTGADAARLKP